MILTLNASVIMYISISLFYYKSSGAVVYFVGIYLTFTLLALKLLQSPYHDIYIIVKITKKYIFLPLLFCYIFIILMFLLNIYYFNFIVNKIYIVVYFLSFIVTSWVLPFTNAAVLKNWLQSRCSR
jgi:hypothetical protein